MDRENIPPYDETAHTGCVRHIFVRKAEVTGQIMVCVVTNSETLPGGSRLADMLQDALPAVTTVLHNVNPRPGNVILGDRPGYSPLHNLKPGTAYPATLVTTADHDDRVVPAHSFKFAATLQDCQAGPNPVLIRIDTKAGHGGGKPLAKVLEEQADIYSFILYNMGVKY